jgi:glycosyltransferase involved in cell wall biosynthesis
MSMKLTDTGGGSRTAAFDGIVCIGGEDWWYHNRGHFDFQVMRRLARHWPVLFVNSLAVRMPSPVGDTQFAARLGRKLRSFARGLVHVENGFWVFSPVSVPGPAGQRLSGWALGPQIRLAAARAGIRNPVLWVHCPAGAPLVDELAHARLVLQRTDRFEAFPDADPAHVGAQIASLGSRADLVVYAAPHLMAEEATQTRRQVLVTHGVELERFVAAGEAGGREPGDIGGIGRPRVGFIGGIDAHTFDAPLFLEVARRLPEARFVMIGGSSLPNGWCTLPNVTLLGRKPYEQVARYMAAMDVLVMPWNRSAWIEACNPIKLKEYLAVGRPVVTTDFPALDGWRDLVRVTADAESFAAAIRASLAAPFDPARGRSAVAAESWDAKADLVRASILELGVTFAPRHAASRWAA